jgi:protein SCO1/2
MSASIPLTILWAAVLALVAGGATGCSRAEKGAAAVSAAAATTEKRHPVTGRVIAVMKERGTLLVDHDEIPGYMPRMTMEFYVTSGDLALAKEGAALRADLVEEEGGRFSLEKVWFEDAVSQAAVAAAAGSLRQDTTIRGRSAYREVGENLPDFALYNQEGAVVSAAKFRGKQILLNFIFSRCPVATMCPAATLKMMDTQAKAKVAGVTNLELVSITLDPEYDTPGVLKTYAQTRGIDTSNFSFLTGPERAIKDLLSQFGVLTEATKDESILKHTLATLLINEQGKIIWRADGSGWLPAEFVEKMKR